MFVSRITDKVHAHEQKFNNLKELSDFTLKYDWSPFVFRDSYRHSSSWALCDVMVLDIDSGCTIDRAKELFKEYTYYIQTTKSHTEANHRFRVIIPLSSTIKDPEIYKNTWYSLSNQFHFIDQQCKDVARFYYKSITLVHTNVGRSIDPVLEVILPKHFEKPRLELKLTKGKLSRATMEFIVNGAMSGERNIGCFKAAKDMQEQGYTIEETNEKLMKSPCLGDDFSESELERTIWSAFTNDPKHDPRGLAEKKEYIAMSISDLENDPDLHKKSEPIHGPDFLDVTEERWRKGEVLAVVAGSGTGKSAISMKIIKDIIHNNKDNDDIHFFFSLEMPSRTIVKRWTKLVGKNNKDSSRLYVIANKDTDERITWQHIVKFVQDTCKKENKKVGAVIVDHFMALSDKIDTTKEPNFDVSTDVNSGRGKNKTISVKEMCRLMKVVAEMLNCFLIIQNQSTIERAGHGDTPMGINAAYGAAQFAWFCDYIITVWQPLKRVQDECMIAATGWQYSKIREVGLNDLTRVYTMHNLYYDLATGDFRALNELESHEFDMMNEKAIAIRKSHDKKEAGNYKASPRVLNHVKTMLKLVEDKKSE